MSQEKCTGSTDLVNNSWKFRCFSSPRAANVCGSKPSHEAGGYHCTFLFYIFFITPSELHILLYFLSSSSFYYAGNSYSSWSWFWRKYISSLHHICNLTTMSPSPPHPSGPGDSGSGGNSGLFCQCGTGKLYLTGAALRARRKEECANVLQTQPATCNTKLIK